MVSNKENIVFLPKLIEYISNSLWVADSVWWVEVLAWKSTYLSLMVSLNWYFSLLIHIKKGGELGDVTSLPALKFYDFYSLNADTDGNGVSWQFPPVSHFSPNEIWKPKKVSCKWPYFRFHQLPKQIAYGSEILILKRGKS